MKKNYAYVLIAIAALQGGYMLFDGTHKLKTGSYFGGQVGPWGHLASAVGISPDSMAPAFIVFGALWLAAGAGMLLDVAWAPLLLTILAILTLAYPVFGTLLALLALFLLFKGKDRSSAMRPTV
jgi:hypothetical protein